MHNGTGSGLLARSPSQPNGVAMRIATVLILALVLAPAAAADVFENADFEAGDLTAWGSLGIAGTHPYADTGSMPSGIGSIGSSTGVSGGTTPTLAYTSTTGGTAGGAATFASAYADLGITSPDSFLAVAMTGELSAVASDIAAVSYIKQEYTFLATDPSTPISMKGRLISDADDTDTTGNTDPDPGTNDDSTAEHHFFFIFIKPDGTIEESIEVDDEGIEGAATAGDYEETASFSGTFTWSFGSHDTGTWTFVWGVASRTGADNDRAVAIWDDATPGVSGIPEPGSMTLLVIAGGILAWRKRRSPVDEIEADVAA